MANPLFNDFGTNNTNGGIPAIINDVQKMMQTFKGNPKEEVQKLLNSGQLSQKQFNQFAQIANQIMAFMPK